MAKVYDTATDLITFARLQSQNTTSGSSYLGSDGLLKFAAEDEPRIEYGSDGSLKGLLIEEQRTNLITRSQSLTFGVDSFFKSAGGTVTNNAGTFLDGSNDAVRIDFGVSDYSGIQIAITSGQTYTFSFFAKPINVPGNWYITTQGSAGVFSKNIAADLATDEWVRVHLTFTAAATTIQQFRLVNNDDVEAYICGFQLEAGSFATSYIPTSGSQQTRSADVASIPVSAFGYNQDAGTVVVEFDMLSDNAGSNTLTQAAFGFHDGTSNNRLELWSASAGVLTLRDRIAPVNHDAISSGNSLEQPTKSAASYASGEASKLVVNGGTASVAATATTPPAYSTLLLGDTQNVDAELNGHIKSIKYYPRRLTDAQLQELTA